MSQGKGSARRPQFVLQNEFSRKWNETFKEHERRLANDPKEHARRLRASLARDVIDGSVAESNDMQEAQ